MGLQAGIGLKIVAIFALQEGQFLVGIKRHFQDYSAAIEFHKSHKTYTSILMGQYLIEKSWPSGHLFASKGYSNYILYFIDKIRKAAFIFK